MKQRMIAWAFAVLCAVVILSVCLFPRQKKPDETMWDKDRVQVCLERGNGFVAKAYVQQPQRGEDVIF